MKDKIIKIILDNKNDFISGEELSNKLGVSRAAIWKHIKKLKEEGYNIESVNKKGYRLMNIPGDLLTFENITYNLDTKFIGKKIHYLKTVDSTNDYLKKIGDNELEGTVVISEEQTNGKGRLGRSWHSKSGDGIWLSILLKPNIVPYKAPFITMIAGVSIVKALRNLGINADIKWPNDIIINNKKVCGVLTELSAEIERVNYIIVGIGINVKNTDFPEELKDKATSLYNEGYRIERVDIVKNIFCEFEKLYDKYIEFDDKSKVLELFRRYSNTINKDVYLIKDNEKELVKCIDINEEGNLIVKDVNGNLREVFSGEVSLRGMNGYV